MAAQPYELRLAQPAAVLGRKGGRQVWEAFLLRRPRGCLTGLRVAPLVAGHQRGTEKLLTVLVALLSNQAVGVNLLRQRWGGAPVAAGPGAGEAAPVPELRSQRCRLRRRVGCPDVVCRQNALRYRLCNMRVAGDQRQLLNREVQVQEVALVQREPRQVAALVAEEGGGVQPPGVRHTGGPSNTSHAQSHTPPPACRGLRLEQRPKRRSLRQEARFGFSDRQSLTCRTGSVDPFQRSPARCMLLAGSCMDGRWRTPGWARRQAAAACDVRQSGDL